MFTDKAYIERSRYVNNLNINKKKIAVFETRKIPNAHPQRGTVRSVIW